MSNLGIINIELENENIELDLDVIVPISSDTNREFAEQPSLYAYVATLAARAEAAWRDAKNYKEEMYAKTDKAVRQDLEMSDVKVTEPRVKQEIMIRRGYTEAIMYELDMHEQYLIMRAVVTSMEQRAQMLISLGAHLRAEAEQTGMLIKQTKTKLRKPKKKKSRVVRVGDYGEEPEGEIPF